MSHVYTTPENIRTLWFSNISWNHEPEIDSKLVTKHLDNKFADLELEKTALNHGLIYYAGQFSSNKILKIVKTDFFENPFEIFLSQY